MQEAALSVSSEAPRRFLDAAARLFARDGFHAVSMRDIAREVGVSPGAVYAHYPSKARVLAAVHAEGVRHVAESVDAAIAPASDSWQRLERACRAHLDAILDAESGYAQVLTRVLPGDVPGLADEMTARRDRYEERFRALIAALPLRPDIDRTLMRMTLLGALNWTQVWYGRDRAEPVAIARALVSLLRRGAEAREEETP